MFVFLDIGFTLIGGPNVGPAGRLIQELELPPSSKPAINSLLFESPVSSHEALLDRITETYGADRNRAYLAVRDLWERQVDEAYALPGSREALESLKKAGARVGFISNIWAPFLQAFSSLFPEEYEEYPVFASFERGVSKPNLDLYRMALRETGADPERTVMIGDTYEMDIAPPLKLGMKTVWVLHRTEKERKDLVRVLNGDQPRPSLSLDSIEALRQESLERLMASQNGPISKRAFRNMEISG